MSNPNEHIKDFLKYYFELKKPPHYAVLLKGKWGVGKTWFLKDVIRQLYSPNDQVKRYLYVSLYGVASFEEIENDFFRQLHPVLSSKGMALAGKIGKGILKTTLKIDLDGDGKSDASVSSQVPDINLPDYLSNTEGLTLVFDDLERASMDLESLLGYINYFVEHQGYKVIIIANEEELFSIEEKTKISYRRIKEKLIGKTFEVQPQLDLAINNFIENIEPPNLEDILRDKISIIKQYYELSEYGNLRHLNQALMDFARLLSQLSNDIIEKKGAIDHLLRIFLIFSFEIKSGNMLSEDITNLEGLYAKKLIKKESASNDFYDKIRRKYPDFNSFDLLLDKHTWFYIFDKGILLKDKIQESIYNSKYFLSDKQPNWVKLWNYIDLNDEDFKEILNTVLSDLRLKEYNQLGVIKHVAGLLFFFSDINITNENKNTILNYAKSCIDDLVSKKILLVQEKGNSYFSDTGWAGLGYYKDSREFEELCNYIKMRSKDQEILKYQNSGKTLLDVMVSDVDSFYDKVSAGNNDAEYRKVPVLSNINPNDFSIVFLNMHPTNWKKIIFAISTRYKSIYTRNENLLPEIAWLQKIMYLLNKEAAVRKGDLSSYQLSSLVDNYLVPAIKTLHKDSASPKEVKNYAWSVYINKNNYLKTVSLLI